MQRNFEQMFDVTIQPLLFTAMFAGIFGGAISGDVESYLPLIIPGLIGQTVLTACVATGVQLREDMDKGVFDRFKSLPIARIAPLAGPMLADMLRYLTRLGADLRRRDRHGLPPRRRGARRARRDRCWPSSRAGRWRGSSRGSAPSVAAPRACRASRLMILFPLTFLSNAFVPTDTMPAWLQAFADVNPVSLVITAIRDLANDGAVTADVGWALLGCARGGRGLPAARRPRPTARKM